MCKTILPAYNSAKIIKKSITIFQSYDHKCILLPPFYGSQCRPIYKHGTPTYVVGIFSFCRFATCDVTVQRMWKYLFSKLRLTGERTILSVTAEESQLRQHHESYGILSIQDYQTATTPTAAKPSQKLHYGRTMQDGYTMVHGQFRSIST